MAGKKFEAKAANNDRGRPEINSLSSALSVVKNAVRNRGCRSRTDALRRGLPYPTSVTRPHLRRECRFCDK